jgi:hypothetical protein
MFSWVKAHVGIHGNELADRLPKEAVRSDGASYEFDSIPKNTLHHEADENPNKNGKSNGQYATRLLQRNGTSHLYGTG